MITSLYNETYSDILSSDLLLPDPCDCCDNVLLVDESEGSFVWDCNSESGLGWKKEFRTKLGLGIGFAL